MLRRVGVVDVFFSAGDAPAAIRNETCSHENRSTCAAAREPIHQQGVVTL